MLRSTLFLFLTCCALLLTLAPAEPVRAQETPLTVEQIMQEPETWIGGWPQNIRWGERGRYLYFDWNPEGQFESDSLYRVPVEPVPAQAGSGEPQKVAPEVRRPALPFFTGWHHGEHVYDEGFERKVYASDGDVYLFDREAGEQTRLTQTRAREANPRFSIDGAHVVFTREGNLFRRTLASGAVEQITDLREGEGPDEEEPDAREEFLEEQQLELFEVFREEEAEQGRREAAQEREERAEDVPPTFYYGDRRVGQLRLSPGGRFVTFTLGEQGDAEQTQVLDFVTETGYAETLEARPKVGVAGSASTLHVQDLRRDTTYQIDLHQLPGAYDVPAYRREQGADLDSSEAKRTLSAFGPSWSSGGQYAVIDVRARDNKDRWIARLDPATGDLTVIDRQHDDAWIAGPGISWWGGASALGWLPGDEHIYFQSEASGYSHLYTAHVETGEVTQLTHGDFEVFDQMLSQDGETFYFLSSETTPHERHVYRMDAAGGEPVRLTTLTGMNTYALSPDGERLALLNSRKNRPPEVYLQPAEPRAEAARITHSPTEEWLAYDWRIPEIVRFEASDGVEVPAQVFRPEDPNGAAVLFVHGAGYLQNVVRGWTGYFREYMFHNLLADLGYTVLNVDYRASAGYGRDWRTAVYRHMGGRDLQDYVDAQEHVEETYGIGPERTFIYGGSYGGFIALMALFTEAEHFGGGAALRAVTDWAHYNHPYTANILNTPQTDSLAYARSSPIYFAEGLADPLLIAHGMIDTNVHFQDVVRLAQRLIALGKEDWEMAVYPVEGHGFTEPASWADEYRRILELIRTSVGPQRGVTGREPAIEEVGVGGR